MNWDMVRLGDACIEDKSIVDGNSSRLPYLGLEMIEPGTGNINWSASTVRGISTCFVFDTRHVLYGKLRPYLNKVALPDIEGRCSTEIIPLLPKDGVCREYIGYLLRRQDTVDYVMPENNGTRMPRADMKHLLNMRIPLPPLSEQRRIVAEIKRQLAAVHKARVAAEEQVSLACELNASLLRKVFCGNGWETRKLGQVGYSLIGLTYSPSNIAPDGIPVLRSGNIQNARLDLSDLVRVRQSIPDFLYLQEGDILICARNGSKDLIGKSALVTGLREPMTFGAFMTVFRSPYNPFLIHFLQTEEYRRQLTRSTTNTINQLTQNVLLNIEAPLPPLSEQSRIVAILADQCACADKSTRLLQEQYAAINAMPAAILRQAFSDMI